MRYGPRRHGLPVQTLLVLALSLALGPLHPCPAASAEPAPGTTSPAPIGPDEIRPGMRGYGLTVFGGTLVERFDVEVLGVLRNKTPGGDMILVRASGDVVARAGVIAGMSGSPIYLDGRLAGALAFAWTFAKEAIAGVQPIGLMRRLADAPAGGSTPAPSSLSVSEGLLAPSSTLAPIRTPVIVAGFQPSALAELGRLFDERGLLTLTGTGSPSGGSASAETATTLPLPDPAAVASIVPGQAVAAALVTGDLSIAAVGTVTARDGDRILAFGHPFMGLGAVELPLLGADVQTVLPSLALSFKMANAMAPVGVLVRDGATGIAGVLGRSAPMTPVRISLRGPGDLTRSYNVAVARHERLTPALVRAVLSSVLSADLKDDGPATLTLHASARITGGRTFALDRTATTPSMPVVALVDALAPLMALLSNPLEPTGLEELDVTVTVDDEVRSAAIDELRWNARRYRPGDEVRCAVILRPWRGEPTFRTFVVPLPDDLPDGTLRIEVTGGSEHMATMRTRDPGLLKPRDVDALTALLEGLPATTDLVASFTYGSAGVRMGVHRLPQAPPAVLAIMDTTRDARFTPLQDERTVRIPTPWVVTGSSRFDVTIQRDLDVAPEKARTTP